MKYEEPKIEIIYLETKDVVTASTSEKNYELPEDPL